MPSSSTSNTQNSSSTNATQQSSYAPQVADLTAAYNNAMGAYNQSSQAQAPTNFTAAFSPQELQAFQGMVGYGANNALPNSQAADGTALSGAGTTGATGALTGLSDYNPSATNNPGSLVDAANQYVAGQNIPAQVAAAMQGATQTARDVTLPGIEQNAAMGGNTNSTRTGIADGLVQRGLAEQQANLQGSLSGQAFQQGLSLAQSQAQNNNTNELAALGTEGQLGNSSASTGGTLGNSSVVNMIQQLSAGATGGAGLTAADQANLTNQNQQYQSGVSSPYASLQQLMSIISGNTGMNTNANTTGTAATQGTATASPLSTAGGILGLLGNIL